MIENKDRQWTWKIGILRGLGECCWQESWSEMRRITKMSMDPKRGPAFEKGLIGGRLAGYETIPIDGMLLFSKDATGAISDVCERLWTGSVIQPVDTGGFRSV